MKRALDIVIAGTAGILLTPVMAGLAAAIKLDSPGPVLFKQKRVGKDKQLFEIWKFRTMRTDTPKDMPTHMLNNPDAYITRTGHFMRKYSLDELPQLYQCVLGQMSLIGPRPALWNQEDLIAERDKYGANALTPGLTGWAQINGRDELEIPVKARFDGEYLEHFGLLMDMKCFLGTIGSVLHSDGVVEGGTGAMRTEDMNQVGDCAEKKAVVSPDKLKKEIQTGAAVLCAAFAAAAAVFTWLIRHLKGKGRSADHVSVFTQVPGDSLTDTESKKKSHALKGLLSAAALLYTAVTAYENAKRHVTLQDTLLKPEPDENMGEQVDRTDTAAGTTPAKKILITGAHSYIGTAVEAWLLQTPDQYQVDTLDMKNPAWREVDFTGYDVVYHVAGIAHEDVSSVSRERQKQYYEVNTDLAVETALRARKVGVHQFIFMSSMIVYSGCDEKVITEETQPKPSDFYSDSKWRADQLIREIDTDSFKVVILRPPMVYGKGCKGNYVQLDAIARKLPVFPIVNNTRSMLYIENLCQFVKLMIDHEESGVFFPQDGEYVNTSDLVQMIAQAKGHRMLMLPLTDLPVRTLRRAPGKIGILAQKAFGDCAYDMSMSEYQEDYRVRTLTEAVRLTASATGEERA